MGPRCPSSHQASVMGRTVSDVIEQGLRLMMSQSRGTIFNSYDLTTCPSCVQAPESVPCASISRTDYPSIDNQYVTESQAH